MRVIAASEWSAAERIFAKRGNFAVGQLKTCAGLRMRPAYARPFQKCAQWITILFAVAMGKPIVMNASQIPTASAPPIPENVNDEKNLYSNCGSRFGRM